MLGLAFDDERVVVAGFDVDVFDSGAGDVAVEVEGMSVFFEVESGNKTVQEAVAMGKVSIEFVDVVEDRAEVSVDTSAISEPIQARVELRERRHVRF